MRGAALEAEVRQAMQLRIARQAIGPFTQHRWQPLLVEQRLGLERDLRHTALAGTRRTRPRWPAHAPVARAVRGRSTPGRTAGCAPRSSRAAWGLPCPTTQSRPGTGAPGGAAV